MATHTAARKTSGSGPATRGPVATEIKSLLDSVCDFYGYDFRGYAPASLRRRILKCVSDEGLSTVSELQGKVLHDPLAMQNFIYTVSVLTTAMFRDADFYLAFRSKIVPILATYPFARIWHAGCSTGEEVYSTAILLAEEGIYDRVRIYATDLNEAALETARAGIYPLKSMKEYTEKYQAAGGKKSFSQHYTAKYGNAIIKPNLGANIVWAQHNLVTDSSFNEFHVIICRNVMIYFGKELQDRVHELIHSSLSDFGVLCLGAKETLRLRRFEDRYETLDEKAKLYRKIS